MPDALTALSTALIASQTLVLRGHPVYFGNPGHCIYCSAKAPASVDDLVKHFDDCPWEILRKSLALDVGYNA